MAQYQFSVRVQTRFLPEQSEPGEAFQYTSGCRLRTPSGTMHGTYFCVADDGERFEAEIPMFVLDAHGVGAGTARVLH